MATIYFLFFVGIVAACGFAWDVYSDKQRERKAKMRWLVLIQSPSGGACHLSPSYRSGEGRSL